MKHLKHARVLAPLVGLALLLAPPTHGAGGPGFTYLDLEAGPGLGPAIPGNCATWHELWPAFCVNHHQDAYTDNDSDGMISPCDNIKLDGVNFHITWVGPTYFLTCLDNGAQAGYEPNDPQTGGNPTCEVWHQIFPVFSQEQHIEGWQDNGDGLLSACDNVVIGGRVYHIDRIGLNIIIEPGPTSTEEGSWGRVKGLYR